MATSLVEGLQNTLTFILQRMAHLRQCDDAWNFVLDGSPLDNARMLFFATQHHLTGRTESKVTNMPCSSNGLYAASMALASVEESAASVNTCWYSVPNRNYDTVSVGVIISENEDTLDLLSLNHCFRHARYARNGTNGEYFTVHLDVARNFVEVFYLAPISMTERKRALIRFDYVPFMAATRNAKLDVNLCVAKLINTVRSCHIVSEYRNCPVCASNCNGNISVCTCKLNFYAPQGPFDLEHNTLNMLDQQGEYVGFSYHYDRDNNILKEFFNKCEIVGGIGNGGMNKSKRLVTLAIQRYLKDLPLKPHKQLDIESDLHQEIYISNINNDSNHTYEIVRNDLDNELTITNSIQTEPIISATSSEVSSIYVPPPPSIENSNCFVDPTNVNCYDNNIPGDTVNITMQKTVQHVAPISRGITIPSDVGISKKPPKPAAKRRGRRPRPPVQKPPQPVLIAPKPIGVPGVPGVGNADNEELYGGFKTQEEYKNHLKKLRSRMSAARANERRKEKRKRQLQQQKEQQEQEQKQKVLVEQADDGSGDTAKSKS